ncbi:hypothetical protein [Ferviditalea candida]|uniref:Major facilitator superfamily (MFS) profile domain-containing protein n=1 Tax=Ferviditalea candida TaxID=3108399 RepID=A0ABU5ZDB2_9BACL|nr:hypothetical protein [Paenibacillaceae bacterium T2]
MKGSAAGVVSGTGEIFGGGIAPVIAGFVAVHFGIDKILYNAMAGLILVVIFALFLKETAPVKAIRAHAQADLSAP